VSAAHKINNAAAGLDGLWTAYAKGVEGLAELGRQAVEKASAQNRDAVTAWKQGVDVAVEGLQRVAQAQKDLLAVASERGRVASSLVTQNAESVAKTVAGVAAVIEGFGSYVASAQKQAYEFVASQNAAAYDAAKKQFESSGNAAVETFQRGVETLFETQKTVLRAQDAA
jgi:hypothetical protein